MSRPRAREAQERLRERIDAVVVRGVGKGGALVDQAAHSPGGLQRVIARPLGVGHPRQVDVAGLDVGGDRPRAGDLVALGIGQGEVIARSGNTGNSTGPHLHFETRIKGKPVNPMRFL